MFLESAEVKMKRSAYRLILVYYDDVLRMLFALDFFFVFCVYKYKQYLSDDIIEELSVYIVIMFLVFFVAAAAADDADGK